MSNKPPLGGFIFCAQHGRTVVGESPAACCPENTYHMFGNAGIYNCTRVLDELKISHESTIAYAASHVRAIIDLVIGAIFRGQSTDHVVLDDWMPRLGDKQEVYDLLRMADGHLSVEQDKALRVWLQKNSSLF